MKITLKRLSIGLAAAGMLTIYGCGGGGGGDAAAPSTSSMTVATSLGKFSPGTKVKLKKSDGTELSTGSIGADGKATLTFSGYAGPVVVEVLGGAGVTYYDEKLDPLTGKGTTQNFIDGQKLIAALPAAQAEVGVTALTHAAAAQLDLTKPLVATAIDLANKKVAAVFGYTDGASILQAPTLVHKDTGNTLVYASTADNYALILAALAKTATGSSTAADVSVALASDLKDGKLDGQADTTPIPAYAPATLKDMYQSAATDLADSTSQTVIAGIRLPIDDDVTDVITVSNQSDVSLAKAMFAELRTTLNSFANGKTGFLDTQATHMQSDLTANVTPEMSKVIGRISVLRDTIDTFEDARTYSPSSNTKGFVLGKNPITGADALIRMGNFSPVIYGFGSADFCWTDSTTGITSKMTCAHAGSDSYDAVKNRLKMVVFELTGTATNPYSYTATRYNFPVTVGMYGQVTLNGTPSKAQVVGSDPLNPSYIPSGSGTVAMTGSGSNMTGLTLNGTLPPSATAADGKTFTTGVDTIAISAVRTALPTANHFRFTLSGSVSTTNAADSAKVVTLSFDNGSFIDLDETNASTGGTKSVAAKLVGTAKTLASKFTGTVEVGSFMTDADGRNFDPTKVVFTGSISDTSTGGAGEILTGKLEATAANYNLFHSNQPESSSNFLKTSMTFTGTVQAPARPLLKLVVAVARTGLTTGDTTLNYSYGTTSITGSGTVDSANSASNNMTLSNQNGIQLVTKTGIVSKSGTPVATLAHGAIHYADGVTESLNIGGSTAIAATAPASAASR